MCDKYWVQGADVYGYCLYRYVGSIPKPELLPEYCAAAGDWEDQCRHGWVSGKMNPASKLSTETLLEACGDSVDCTFELIDRRVADDVLVQIDRCGRYAGRYSGDCVGHAMQRWYQQMPDSAEFERVIAFDKLFFDKVGHWAGAVVQCQEVGECPPGDRLGLFCRHAVKTFQKRPDDCPPLRNEPLPHNKGTLRSQKAGDSVPTPPTPNQPLPGSASHPPGTRPPGSTHGPPNAATPPPNPGKKGPPPG